MEEAELHGLHVLPPSQASRMRRAAEERNLDVLQIDLRDVRSKSALLGKIREALALPSYFQSNWDSLEECLRDLKDAVGWVLIFDSAESLLTLQTEDLAALRGVLSATASFWSEDGRIFGAILVGDSALEQAFEAR